MQSVNVLLSNTSFFTYLFMISTYLLVDAELESSILDHKNAIVIVSWLEKTFTLLQFDKHHVATQLEEQGLLKVTQDSKTSCRINTL